MPTAEQIQMAHRNGTVAEKCYVQDRSINVAGVIDLLVGGAQPGRHVAIRRNANRLLDLMTRGPWQVTAATHSGGHGSSRRTPDQTRHITVRVLGSGYHLRQDARGHLFQVSGAGLLDFRPWAAPGTDPLASIL